MVAAPVVKAVEMNSPSHALQAVLGTDKKNPLFTVYRDQSAGELHVYYGFELPEVVPDDKGSPRFKLMVAQLSNAGVKGVTLSAVFGVDRKVMRKWGRALKSGDPQKLVDAIKGRGPRKLTPEIRAFIRMRFPLIYAEHPGDYSSRMRREIREVFGTGLSGETLRHCFNELKARGQQENEREQAPGAAAPEPPEEASPPGVPGVEPAAEAAGEDGSQADDHPAKKGALAAAQP